MTIETSVSQIWASSAWFSEGKNAPTWHDNVLLSVDQNGHWQSIKSGVTVPPSGAQIAPGPLMPSFINAHSHAFQRAFAGLTEYRNTSADDFWSWRKLMYGVANRITPKQLQAIASQLFIELLRGGYTQVCEFHYLKHQADGTPYDDELTMTWALHRAAKVAGLGLTMLPVLYERAGFEQPNLHVDQRRFRQSATEVWRATQAINAKDEPLLNAGLAIHSIRAASKNSVDKLLALANAFHGPIHIHVAEQTAEVDASKTQYGARPIQWLSQNDFLDNRWHLVHATHTTPDEISVVADHQASLVICPTTEANLGDGLSDLPNWFDHKVAMTTGSDSHSSRDAIEEFRWLEYGQRLHLRKRNISADPSQLNGSSAQRLLALNVKSAASAAGLPTWGLQVGARADAIVLRLDQPCLLGIAQQHWLDALVFSSPTQPWQDVLVTGKWVIRDGVHLQASVVAQEFVKTMQELHNN
jgi:formimidoylglutamate deiminase